MKMTKIMAATLDAASYIPARMRRDNCGGCDAFSTNDHSHGICARNRRARVSASGICALHAPRKPVGMGRVLAPATSSES